MKAEEREPGYYWIELDAGAMPMLAGTWIPETGRPIIPLDGPQIARWVGGYWVVPGVYSWIDESCMSKIDERRIEEPLDERRSDAAGLFDDHPLEI